jgi:alpha-beta hydrolase superfamily lysophospholipase
LLKTSKAIMSITVPRPSRRSLLLAALAAAPTFAGHLFATIRPQLALTVDQKPGTLLHEGRILSNEYWGKKGEVSLYIYRKRIRPLPGQPSPPILFLVHGSSLSSRPTFDLTVPGHDGYSAMDQFARYGFDVWTMDCEGYGRSSQTEGNSDVASGVEDLKVATDVIARETRREHFHFYGESSGALRAGAFAMARPARVHRLVLGSFTWTGQGSPTLAKRAEGLDFYRKHNRRPRDRNMIRSIFTRDKPGTFDPAVAEAVADAELQFGDSVPTGTYLDMTANLPLVDPIKVRAPVLIVRGQYDGVAAEEDLLNFFQRLPNSDRQFAIVPGAAHAISLSINRHLLWHVTRAFLDMPPRLDEIQEG